MLVCARVYCHRQILCVLSSQHDIRKRIAIARNCMASLDHNTWHSSISPPCYDSIESSSFRSFSMEQKHGPLPDNSRGIWMHLTSGICGACYTLRGGPTLIRRSADSLTSHGSHTSSVPRALSSLVTLHMLWTTVEPLGPMWPLCQGTGTTNRANCITTWLTTTESDLAPLNDGLATAYHWAHNRQAWSTLVGTAMSCTEQATWWWWWSWCHNTENTDM